MKTMMILITAGLVLTACTSEQKAFTSGLLGVDGSNRASTYQPTPEPDIYDEAMMDMNETTLCSTMGSMVYCH